jgi:hypothetical protein
MFALGLLVLSAATGCRMCACPYDYCGPVLEDGCGYCGGANAMQGNMHMNSGDEQSAMPGQMQEEVMPGRSGSPTVAPPMQSTPAKPNPPQSQPQIQPFGVPQVKAHSGAAKYSSAQRNGSYQQPSGDQSYSGQTPDYQR